MRQLDERGGIVFTPNIDHLMILQKDREFYNAYKMADYRVCDGQILMYSLQFLGTPIKEKISGSDRLLSEPARLGKRYLIQYPPFLGLALKNKINIYQDPFTHL